MEQRILQSLLSSSAYPDPVSSVHLVQTHVSFIFITDNLVYKIKKPVDLGFLNFTTLDRRRFYCNEEVRLNRRLCPDVYLGVVELRESPEGARFFGDGAVIDYAVRMKRLPEGKMLDRLLRENKVTADDIRRIARTIGAFHRDAERNAEIDAYGSVEAIRRNWDENFGQVGKLDPLPCNAKTIKTVSDWVDTFLGGHADMLADRVARGFIRDCDGDIHSGNICLTDRVLIFDCIEFDKRLRYSDTAADIAFLLMDFEFHDRRDFSSLLLEEYKSVTGDVGIDTVLAFYKTCRAVVRGKVAGLKAVDPAVPPVEQEDSRREATRYFMLAAAYAVRDKLPVSLIITCGLTGTGKTNAAANLASLLGADLFSSDVIRKRLARIPGGSRKLSGYDRGIYSASYNKATYRTLLSEAESSLRAGRTVIADATFRKRQNRDRFRRLAKTLAVPFHIVQTFCPEAIVKERLERRIADPRTVSDGRWELFGTQKREFEPPDDSEGCLIRVDTSRSPAEVSETILHAMVNP